MQHFVGEMQQFVGETMQFVGEMKQICWGNEANGWENEAKCVAEGITLKVKCTHYLLWYCMVLHGILRYSGLYIFEGRYIARYLHAKQTNDNLWKHIRSAGVPH